MLPAVSVTESLMKVNVVTSYQRFQIGEPYALAMTVAAVKAPSFAYESGLRKGMEIISIDGKKITGLTPAQVERVLAEPRKDAVVLLVRGGGIKKPKEIRISLTAPKDESLKDEPAGGDGGKK